jgi:thiol-disulfide isomerase/thioredoxin
MEEIDEIRKKKMNELKEKLSGEKKNRVLIEVLALSGCSHCPAAAEMAYRVASQYDNVDVAIVNVATPEGELKARKLGVMGVPAIVINGKLAFVGTPQADLIMHDAVRKAM